MRLSRGVAGVAYKGVGLDVFGLSVNMRCRSAPVKACRWSVAKAGSESGVRCCRLVTGTRMLNNIIIENCFG